jgi:hypothetical protein
MTALSLTCSLADRALLDLRMTFRRDEHTEAAVAEIVRAERECCPGMDLRVTTEPDTLVLEYCRERG